MCSYKNEVYKQFIIHFFNTLRDEYGMLNIANCSQCTQNYENTILLRLRKTLNANKISNWHSTPSIYIMQKGSTFCTTQKIYKYRATERRLFYFIETDGERPKESLKPPLWSAKT